MSAGSKGQERADKHKYKKTVEYMDTANKEKQDSRSLRVNHSLSVD